MPAPATQHRPVAIVTGAGSGIGRATAVALGGLGYQLVLVGRREKPLEQTAQDIARATQSPQGLKIVAIDISRHTAAAIVIESALNLGGRIDALINNAGSAPMAGIADITPGLINETFAINTFAPAYLTHACWPHFLAQRSGCVVNVTSMSAIDPFPGLAVYAASKCGLDGWTKTIVAEGLEHGITAYSVAPGAVETDMLRSLFDETQLPASQTLASEHIARVIVQCVLGERPGDIGRTIEVVLGTD